MSLVHPFLFASNRQGANRPINFSVIRDPLANAHLEKSLYRQGYASGVPILNFPAEERNYKLLPVEMLQPVQLPFVQEDDLLLQTTRPPLSDGVIAARKKIEPSNTTLERAIFNHFWRYFDDCMRKRVVLRNAVADFLPRGYKDRQEMMFHQKGCAYKFLQAPGMSCSAMTPLGDTTAAFLLRVESIVPGGPGFIAAFGMNAQVTQGFNRLLRYRFPHLLEGRGLTMVELSPTKPPSRPMTDSWMDDWQADVLFEMGVEMPPRPDEQEVALAF